MAPDHLISEELREWLVGSVAMFTMVGVGIQVACFLFSLCMGLILEMDIFFWVLQLSGISIAVIGWQREQCLKRRRR